MLCSTVQLRQTNALVDDARQPNSYLLESLRERDALISRLKKRVQDLEDDTRWVPNITVHIQYMYTVLNFQQ